MSELNICEIFQKLPHRFPFLLVDRVLDYVPGKSLVAIKNVTINEPFFNGHFPIKPVMPGVLIIEALAQACGILQCVSADENQGGNGITYLGGIDNARFKRVVEPGDQLRLEVEVLKLRRGIAKLKCVATVDGQVVCSAEILSANKV